MENSSKLEGIRKLVATIIGIIALASFVILEKIPEDLYLITIIIIGGAMGLYSLSNLAEHWIKKLKGG